MKSRRGRRVGGMFSPGSWYRYPGGLERMRGGTNRVIDLFGHGKWLHI